jgi:hypothetical protein
VTTPLDKLPATLPEKPEGWKRRMEAHFSFEGGGAAMYSVLLPDLTPTPIGYQYDQRPGGLTGFSLPGRDGVMTWAELVIEWPLYLQRRREEEAQHG